MNNREKLLGLLFLALFVADIIAFTTLPPWQFLFFACNHMSLFLAIGFFYKSRYIFTALSSLLLIPQLLWIFDYLLNVLALPSLGITDYLFVPNYPAIWMLLSMKHLLLPFVSLWAIKQYGGTHPTAWKAAYGYGIVLLAVSYLLPRNLNINCAYTNCIPAIPITQTVWMILLPTVMIAVVWLQFKFLKKYLPSK